MAQIALTQLLLLLLIAASAQAIKDQSAADYKAQASAAASRLVSFYDWNTGRFTSPKHGWWNTAGIIETLIDYQTLTGTKTYKAYVDNTFEKNKNGKFFGKYYDDEGWWVITWAKAYLWTKDTKYLNMAKAVYKSLTSGWDGSTCGGGVYWAKFSKYKSTISLELHVRGGMLLYQATGDRSYFNLAKRSWDWLDASGLIQADGRVQDGMKGGVGENCVKETAVYSYNQGVILGGLVGLYEATKDAKYLQKAEKIADAAILFLSPNGILAEPCEPKSCDDNSAHFKGIYMRYLYQLTSALSRAKNYKSGRISAYRQFIERQAYSIWWNARDTSTNQLGVMWSGPYVRASTMAIVQASAMDVINGALGIKGSS
eukprot:jgi/Chrzof1/4900/Cz15g03190.t1